MQNFIVLFYTFNSHFIFSSFTCGVVYRTWKRFQKKKTYFWLQFPIKDVALFRCISAYKCLIQCNCFEGFDFLQWFYVCKAELTVPAGHCESAIDDRLRSYKARGNTHYGTVSECLPHSGIQMPKLFLVSMATEYKTGQRLLVT